MGKNVRNIIGIISAVLLIFISTAGCTGCNMQPRDGDKVFVPPVIGEEVNPYEGQTILKESLRIRMGEDFIGAGMTVKSIISNPKNLIEENVDFLVLENAFKPDALLSTANGKYSGKKPINFTTVKNSLNAARAKGLKVKGHAFVWYRVMNDRKWFFYDESGTNTYVSREVALERLSAYINELFDGLYTGVVGEDNYLDVIDMWDVVNETASQGLTSMPQNMAEGMRTASGDPYRAAIGDDYVVQTFKIAEAAAERKDIKNKLTFVYNDYDSEIKPYKDKAIEFIIKDLIANNCKLDAVGMQFHISYAINTQGIRDTLDTIKNLNGPKIHITELDMNVKSLLNKPVKEIFSLQAEKYGEIFDIFEEYKDYIKLISFWGTNDETSFLNFDGTQVDYPLLFTNDRPKPAFWRIVDPSRFVKSADSLISYYSENTPSENAKQWSFQSFTKLKYQSDALRPVDAEFSILWNENYFFVYVNVVDDTVNTTDKVVIYFDVDNSKSTFMEDDDVTITAKRLELTEKTDGSGYYGIITCDINDVPDEMFSYGFDMWVCDEDVAACWSDKTWTQHHNPSKYGVINPKRSSQITYASKGTPAMSADGTIDSIWDNVEKIIPEKKTGNIAATGYFKVLWDSEYLYVLAVVTDPTVGTGLLQNADSVEVFIDQDNKKSLGYDSDDGQFRVTRENSWEYLGDFARDENFLAYTHVNPMGYVVQMRILFDSVTPAANMIIGFTCQINDGAGSQRVGYANWSDGGNLSYQTPGVFGLLELKI